MPDPCKHPSSLAHPLLAPPPTNNLQNYRLGNGAVGHLLKLNELTALNLSQSRVTSQAVVALGCLPKLQVCSAGIVPPAALRVVHPAGQSGGGGPGLPATPSVCPGALACFSAPNSCPAPPPCADAGAARNARQAVCSGQAAGSQPRPGGARRAALHPAAAAAAAHAACRCCCWRLMRLH